MKLAVGFASVMLMMAAPALAQVPGGAPGGATGLCRDGTYSSAKIKLGACHGHKGVQTWFATSPSAAPPTAAPAHPAIRAKTTAPTVAAAGGGAGQVWVNTKSKVYHCQGDRYYGKTKAGQYMTEAAALAAGAHAEHGKACH